MRRPIRAIFLVNAILLVGCLLFAWDFWNIAFLYWLETMIATMVMVGALGIAIVRGIRGEQQTRRRSNILHDMLYPLAVVLLLGMLLFIVVQPLLLTVLGLAILHDNTVPALTSLANYLPQQMWEYWWMALVYLGIYLYPLKENEESTEGKPHTSLRYVNAVFSRLMMCFVGVAIVGGVYIASTYVVLELTTLSAVLVIVAKTTADVLMLPSRVRT